MSAPGSRTVTLPVSEWDLIVTYLETAAARSTGTPPKTLASRLRWQAGLPLCEPEREAPEDGVLPDQGMVETQRPAGPEPPEASPSQELGGS